MDLSHKLSKVFSGAALKSAADAFHRVRHPISADSVLQQVNQSELERIRAKFYVPGERKHWPKYVDAPRWIRLNIRRAQDLRLNLRPAPLRILDLGSGAGYFLLVSRFLGHSGIGLDIPYPELYQDTFALFGFDRVIWEIHAFEPLPSISERFDLVTAFSICFNAHKTDQLWTSKEWHFFLRDLKTRFLKPAGEIFLGMNPERDGSFYTPALKDFFRQHGASIDRAKVWFKTIDRI